MTRLCYSSSTPAPPQTCELSLSGRLGRALPPLFAGELGFFPRISSNGLGCVARCPGSVCFCRQLLDGLSEQRRVLRALCETTTRNGE